MLTHYRNTRGSAKIENWLLNDKILVSPVQKAKRQLTSDIPVNSDIPINSVLHKQNTFQFLGALVTRSIHSHQFNVAKRG